ncbi:MAG: class I SAM-dependent methyltransferase [Myxococcota bacterium]|jgi:SAM-dependent methyltransferase|nr:methyltransferase domain-containing protein [bacterium]MDP7076171.1 class I SAM-dependent methyltransferase [Myxococcota bacterium]MDP7300436.1 class I SAM-dependent methyltransferase [Myxococcota bacterium]MDP7431560.1 class I SAM-dependent methyltransferase [Myxococcota bacterium]HJO24214.1 class I SAM-dependent methyltransferase [Myxococcota bacterium]
MSLRPDTRTFLQEHLDLFCCPRCGGDLVQSSEELACSPCNARFAFDGNIPLLFAPNDWDASSEDVTDRVKEFYEETPFPNYDDFDDVGSLVEKARKGHFAKQLDDQIPSGTLILECGCGTGQVSNFLSIANRTVFGADICLNSLRLAQEFKERNALGRVGFVQMNLFRPAFKPGIFDLVFCNGVLHHTSDPRRAFRSIARLVRPNGYVLIGLYHRFGRLITDLRRQIFRLSGDRFQSLDPNLRRDDSAKEKRRAWFMDQYKHPHESKHTLGEALQWFEEAGFSFVKSIPRSVPFQPFSPDENLFEPERLGSAFERLLVEAGMTFSGSGEGGFFVFVGRREP